MQKYNYYAFCDIKKLIETTQGYLKIHLSIHNNTKKKLETISINSIKHFIMGGTYITPFTKKLITSAIGSGMMLNTTWQLLQRYVVSIPTLIIAIVGIPLGFTFALVEDTFIYRDFFESFQNIYGIKISDHIKVIESDQGKPLRSFIQSQGFQHLICLKHLLTSLGKTKYSYQIGNLVSVLCQKDIDELMNIYAESWKQIKDQKEVNKLNRLLKKVGLKMEKSQIITIDDERWTEVSISKRGEFRMPSCTNQLESTHGHW